MKVINIASRYARKGLKVLILTSKETSRYYEARGFKVIELGSRRNLYEVARNLFKALRAIDDEDADIVLCEGFEEKGLGLTIMNRLRKASRYNIIRV